jgi:ectoine hydroxylase-related dioxygenase (phytanoyl-CoA dioxygenase family)
MAGLLDESPKGFGLRETVLGADECAALIEDIEREYPDHGMAGTRNLFRVPAVARLAYDARLLRVVREYVGPRPYPFRATLFRKGPLANWPVAWHQDTVLPLEERSDDPEWGPWSTKDGLVCARAPDHVLSRVVALRVHLDPSTADNGPLRVLPGTHVLGILGAAEIRELALRAEPVECLVPRGGVLALRPLLLHSSPRCRSRQLRRVVHIEYAESRVLCSGKVLPEAPVCS